MALELVSVFQASQSKLFLVELKVQDQKRRLASKHSTFHNRIALGILSKGPITLHLVGDLVLTLGQREAFLCQVCT